ncbi:toll-like receptor Tollo [Anopheles cruzii]|uniref:toll-like receptor Tollo n=1 Tax=Anopheles cruzii TaxID=68878 RepID=UPI0022EC9845|nr:toll-like receptor Tollo [Anopheles cruzii]
MAKAAGFTCEAVRYDSYSAIFRNVVIQPMVDFWFSCDSGYYTKTKMTFLNSSMEELPKKLFDSFSTLQNVSLVDCNIKHIERYSLDRAGSLRSLDLSQNQIGELKGFVFVGASNLMTLNLTLNNISHIESTAFHSLSALQLLFLDRNKLGTLNAGVFSPLVALRGIYLNGNELEVLDGGLFGSNSKLEVILVQNNRLRVVDEHAFTVSSGATVSRSLISLQNNSIVRLDLQHVAAQKVILSDNLLQEIYISAHILTLLANNNQISNVTSDTSVAEMKLQVLGLRNNSITSLDSVGRLSSLSTLDLSYNNVGALRLDSFGLLKKLKVLSLERTSISNLQHGTFAQQEALEWLDLSYNNLDSLDMDILTSSTQLQTLYIDGNRLRSIQHEEMKKNFPKLTLLGLTDNRWNCTYLTKLVRYCNGNSIVVAKTSEALRNQTNVKGIYCYDDKNPIRDWNTTVQHLVNGTAQAGDGALEALLKSVMEDVRRYSEDQSDTANKTVKLEGALYDLTKQQLALQRDILAVRQSVSDVWLFLLTNRTTNDTTFSNDEIRRLVEGINNVTLEKQELSVKRMQLELYQQSFKVDKALESAGENADRLTALAKRVEQWVAGLVGSGGSSFLGQLGAARRDADSAGTGAGDHRDTALIVAVLVLVCLMMGVLLFAVYRSNRRSYNVERRRYPNRDSSLTTIVDNEM